eukprot:2376423-Rhodomonas_salina.1
MFVAVASTGGHIIATPRQQPPANALAMSTRPMPYQPPSSVQNGLPPPMMTPREHVMMTPRDPHVASMYYPHAYNYA